ncbi:hypothetical protein LIER_20586 [Lithospermum erythrorhizon]|uniref:Uncharacterized protein n=1 Tax=Lithospermum erythrorhizon TaxID=34254 RepID=A0AAV3QLZ7_LITER
MLSNGTFEDSSNPDRDLNKNEPPSRNFDWIEGQNQADHVESDILSHCPTSSRVGSEDVKSGQNQSIISPSWNEEDSSRNSSSAYSFLSSPKKTKRKNQILE